MRKLETQLYPMLIEPERVKINYIYKYYFKMFFFLFHRSGCLCQHNYPDFEDLEITERFSF